MTDLGSVTIEDFSPCAGDIFCLHVEGGGAQLVLKEVNEKSRYARSGQLRMPFSLLFLGPQGVSFQQGSYTLRHERIGTLDLFLVPVGLEGGAMQLEAVFN